MPLCSVFFKNGTQISWGKARSVPVLRALHRKTSAVHTTRTKRRSCSVSHGLSPPMICDAETFIRRLSALPSPRNGILVVFECVRVFCSIFHHCKDQTDEDLCLWISINNCIYRIGSGGASITKFRVQAGPTSRVRSSPSNSVNGQLVTLGTDPVLSSSAVRTHSKIVEKAWFLKSCHNNWEEFMKQFYWVQP